METVDTVIFKATNNSDRTWREEAEATIELLMKRKREFTSEDVLRILDERGIKTHDNRALGGLFLKQSRAGRIEFTRYTKATRGSRHRAPIAVWQSVREPLEMAD